MKKSYWVTLLWSNSRCVYFIRWIIFLDDPCLLSRLRYNYSITLYTKKCFMFYYHNIIYVGIVRFDVYPTNSPSNKQHHHGEPFAATAAWLKKIGSPPPPGASSEGVIRGRGERILVALILGWRKKLICKLNNVILVFNILPTISSPKRWIYTPPTPPNGRATSQYHLALLRLFFGWLLCVPSLIGGRLRPPNNLFVFIFHR